MEEQDKANTQKHKPIVVVINPTPEEKLRQQEYYRQKALHDEASAILGAKAEGKEEVIAAFINSYNEDGVSYEIIRSKLVKYMKLTDEEASEYVDKYWKKSSADQKSLKNGGRSNDR